jgi:Bacterial pre-peptidase C-terminal domain
MTKNPTPIIHRFLWLVIVFSFFLISACGPAKPAWNARGKWIDLFAEVQRCGTSIFWEFNFVLKQDGFNVTGSTYLLVADGDGGLLKIPGTFSGQMSGQKLTGSAHYAKDANELDLNFDLTNKAETLSGSFTTEQIPECPDGTTKDRISGDVVLITEAKLPVGPDQLEPNNSKAKAIVISKDTPLEGLTISEKDVDWFSFEVTATSKVRVSLEELSNFPARIKLFDENAKTIVEYTADSTGLQTQANIIPYQLTLQKGKYYLAVSAGNDTDYIGKHSANGKYKLSLTVEELPDSQYEQNDTKDQAVSVVLPFDDALFISRDDYDWLRFEMTETEIVLINLVPAEGHVVYADLQSSNGFSVLSDTYSSSSTPHEVALDPGTYYLAIGTAEPSYDFAYQLKLDAYPIPDSASEPNNSRAVATAVTLDFEQTLFLYPGDEDWLKFSLTESQVVTFDVSAALSDFAYELYQGNNIIFSDAQSVDPIQTRVLSPGSYFFRAYEAFANVSYPIKISTQVIPDQNLEPNDSFNNASPISFPFSQSLSFDDESDEDWLSFDLTSTQLITIDLQKGIYGEIAGEFINESGIVLAEFQTSESTVQTFAFEAGKVYLKLFAPNTAGFIFAADIQSDDISDTAFEPNNSRGEATDIALGFKDENLVVINTQHPSLGDEDWFMFTLDKTTQVAINLISKTGINATLFDADGNVLRTLIEENDPILVDGTYYIEVSSSGNAAKYSLSVAVK